ncbi:hypothetical protein MVEN_01945400 [Mycena venus]|uniref:FAD/NAD(P)-binding domain-containing protein n=1 Tax=Mycena venus TaxID=2733690 RepID=A0A8H6XH42_9AGAR|nr:hypothetical protein MVEN_01945400 [Mycena venus]
MDALTLSASTALILLTSGVIWQKFCKSPPTWTAELETLGQPRNKKLKGTAVVCGGSIAGTVSARVLADHFERVILVDPEIQNEKKTRIMQYNAAHILLGLFVAGSRRLWPNFDDEFKAAGGRMVPADPRIHYSGIPLLTPYQDYAQGSFPDTVVMRRSSAQNTLHTLLMQHPTAANITVMAGTVRGLKPSGDMSSIQSVIVRKPDGTQMLLNDVAMVADCTGTTQAGLKWLKSAGFSLPDNIRCSYNGNLRYVTMCFTVPPELAATLPIPEHALNAAGIYSNAPHFELGSSFVGLVKTDNNTMQLLVGNSGDDDGPLPETAAEVVQFISEIKGHAPIPSWFLETTAILCKYGNPSFDNIKIPTQSYVQYHRLPAGDLPSNFVAIGDANLQLNPIHGQGFAKTILNGIALDTLLRSLNPMRPLPKDFSARYFKKNSSYTHGLWRVECFTPRRVYKCPNSSAGMQRDYMTTEHQAVNPWKVKQKTPVASFVGLNSNWSLLRHRTMKLPRRSGTLVICWLRTGL